MRKDLRSFLKLVKEAGPDYYVEVKKPLAIDLEVNVIQQKLASLGRNPVIYCPKMIGSKFPYVSGVFGCRELLALAMDISPEALQKIGKGEILQEFKRRTAKPLPMEWIPASEAPVKQVILKGDKVDLGMFPIPKHYEQDSAKYITMANTISREPDRGIPNVGTYRLQVLDKNRVSVHLVPANTGGYIARRRAELGLPMEVAISIGHHPAMGMAAGFKGPMGTNELEIAGGLMGQPLRVTKAETVDIPVPADAEIILEGVLDPQTPTVDGPFGEFTGYYGESTDCYFIDIKCITMRQDAIYHSLDPKHAEHKLAGVLSLESGLWDVIYRRIPTLKAVYYPPSGRGFHSYVSIAKRVEGEGMLAGLLAVGSDRNHNLTVVVDEDVDVYNEDEVLGAMATMVSFDKDIAIIPQVAGGILNPRAYSEKADEKGESRGGLMAKVIIDATRAVGAKYPPRLTSPQALWQSMKLEDYI